MIPSELAARLTRTEFIEMAAYQRIAQRRRGEDRDG